MHFDSCNEYLHCPIHQCPQGAKCHIPCPSFLLVGGPLGRRDAALEFSWLGGTALFRSGFSPCGELLGGGQLHQLGVP